MRILQTLSLLLVAVLVLALAKPAEAGGRRNAVAVNVRVNAFAQPAFVQRQAFVNVRAVRNFGFSGGYSYGYHAPPVQLFAAPFDPCYQPPVQQFRALPPPVTQTETETTTTFSRTRSVGP